MDISDLGEDHRSEHRTDSRDRQDIGWELLHEFFDDLVNPGTLLFEQIDLIEQTGHLDPGGIGQKTDADRGPRRGLYLFGLVIPEAASAGGVKQAGKLAQVACAKRSDPPLACTGKWPLRKAKDIGATSCFC
jgi:hypothetical protein